jgi:hypothetical protein
MRSRHVSLYRGHRIVVVELGFSWHAIVHDLTGAIIQKDIEGTSLAHARAQAQWVIETRLCFQPERKAG